MEHCLIYRYFPFLHTAPKYYYVSSCTSITVECPQKDWTVHVNRVFGGRKLDATCTTDRPECCKAEMDNRTECLIENRVLVGVQRDFCLNHPGQPCLIFEHSAHYIGCKGNLVSQYTVVEFYCAYGKYTFCSLNLMGMGRIVVKIRDESFTDWNVTSVYG